MTRSMPTCTDCRHDYAMHVLAGAATGVFACRSVGCECIAYVARSSDIALAVAA